MRLHIYSAKQNVQYDVRTSSRIINNLIRIARCYVTIICRDVVVNVTIVMDGL